MNNQGFESFGFSKVDFGNGLNILQGIASELFRPMGYTITFSLLTSLLVALTLVPMLSSKILRFKVKDNSPSASK
jgi:HAE1 family hydrophobic/amphiphilic exporter-1